MKTAFDYVLELSEEVRAEFNRIKDRKDAISVNRGTDLIDIQLIITRKLLQIRADERKGE